MGSSSPWTAGSYLNAGATSSSWMTPSTVPTDMATVGAPDGGEACPGHSSLNFCLEAQKAGPHHAEPGGLTETTPERCLRQLERARHSGLPAQGSAITEQHGSRPINSSLRTLSARPELILKSCFYVVLGKERCGNSGTGFFLVSSFTFCSQPHLKTDLPAAPGPPSFLPIQQKRGRLCFSISRQRLDLHSDWLLKVHGHPQANHCAQRDGVH